jgi:hypothetical protein
MNWKASLDKYLTSPPDDGSDGLTAFAMTDVMSVHQLQNLWFALTGEELEMRPESPGWIGTDSVIDCET